MSDEEFRVNPDRVAEQDLSRYNWRDSTPRFLAPQIVVDGELDLELGEAILEMVRRIAAKHDKPLQKVEVVAGREANDLQFRTIFVRWTSAQGVYEGEFEVFKVTVAKTLLYPLRAPARR